MGPDLQYIFFVMSQNCKIQVANGAELNGLKRIFANKGNCGKRFGAPIDYLK